MFDFNYSFGNIKNSDLGEGIVCLGWQVGVRGEGSGGKGEGSGGKGGGKWGMPTPRPPPPPQNAQPQAVDRTYFSIDRSKLVPLLQILCIFF